MATTTAQREITAKQNLQRFEQEQLVGYWLKRKGITRTALETHPHIDDVVLLMRWREGVWHLLNTSEQAVWGAYWGHTYKKRKALKKKSLNKLEQITITAIDRHKQAQLKINKIKALR